jgi:signal transduction histidine kinase
LSRSVEGGADGLPVVDEIAIGADKRIVRRRERERAEVIVEGEWRMHDAGWLSEGRSCWEATKQMSAALHDLCQPLTTLQCRLEMAGLDGTKDAYRDAVDLGLVECGRLMDAVGSMREIVRAAMQEAEAEEVRAQECRRV